MTPRLQRQPARWTIALLAILVSAPGAGAGEQTPELMLSWNAPFAHNRATDVLERDCADTSGADTLYLSYRLSRDEPVFTGLTGILMFHAQLDDTLTGPWRSAANKPAFIKVQFPTGGNPDFPAGWEARGIGDWRYYPERTRGIIRMIYAVPTVAAAPIEAGRIFCFARVILERTPGESCRAAMCAEWMESKITFSVNALDAEGRQARSSFVSVNSPSGLACSKYRMLAEHREIERAARLKKRLEVTRAREAAREAARDTSGDLR